ncbi:MAG TPA: hypothetical protein VG693_00720, partial [Actinomycetes bacterium]|nr:hypothetical protein [Actinomycetes bacterium]
MRRLLAGALAALLLVSCTGSPGTPEGSSSGGATTTPPSSQARANGQLTADGLRAAVTAAAIRRHLDA